MGQRIILLKQETIGELFQPRKDHALVLRICGPDIPADCKTMSFFYIQQARCFGLLLQSAEWSELVAPDLPATQQINGVMLLPNAALNFHITVMPNPPVSYPPCTIEGFYQAQPQVNAEAAV